MYSPGHIVPLAQYYSSVRQRSESVRRWYTGIVCIEMSGMHGAIASYIPHNPIYMLQEYVYLINAERYNQLKIFRSCLSMKIK